MERAGDGGEAHSADEDGNLDPAVQPSPHQVQHLLLHTVNKTSLGRAITGWSEYKKAREWKTLRTVNIVCRWHILQDFYLVMLPHP
jgi:hypothetical protein